MGVDEAALALVRANMRSLKPPGNYDKVYKEECMYSYDSPESAGGLYVNLHTFQGFGEAFLALDHEKTGNALYLHEVWHKIPLSEEELEQQKAAPDKMALGVEGGFSLGGPPKHKIEKDHALVVMPGKQRIPLPCPALPEIVLQVIEAIQKHEAAGTQELLSVWEEERKVSRYAENLAQLDTGRKISPNPKDWKCEETGATENLWLNLSTGFIGSGRKNWDGSGGNGSALRHFQATGSKYPLVVKLGTITPHGADVYSYATDEDDMVTDPLLAQHLAHWGINMMQMEKTEKTMAELQIQMNLSYEFGRITESGASLKPLSGPGHVGLINLGNSCYMNSVLQVLVTLPEFKARYVNPSDSIFRTAPPEPAQDLPVQLAKLGRALEFGQTGRQAPAPGGAEVEGTDDDAVRCNAVRPLSFKSLVGKGHAEFSSGRQQDALEYFQYLLEQIARCEHANSERLALSSQPPTKSVFTFSVEDRVQCLESGRVSYKRRMENAVQLHIPVEAATNKEEVESYKEREVKRQKLKDEDADAYIGDNTVVVRQGGEVPVIPKVPFAACLERLTAAEVLEDYHSAALNRRSNATKQTRFASFPPYLMLALRRYYVGEGWVPKKLDVLVDMPDRLDLEHLRARGPLPGELMQPEEQPAAGGSPAPDAPAAGAAATAVPDEALVAQLVSMGFSELGCKRAAIATANSGVEAAMEWVLAHMEDPDFNDPLPEAAATAAPATAAPTPATAEADQEKIVMLTGMGFNKQQATAALLTCAGNIERAADWLFSHMDNLDDAVQSVMGAQQQAAGQAPAPQAAQADVGRVLDGPGHYELMGIISHMGSNTSCGHYVCHIKKDGRWVIFNDEKVAESEQPPKDLGYMYLFRRVDQ